MTAVDVDALDKLRDQLAAALVFECELTASAAEARAAVDKLWPVVDRIANERAAAELRAAASDLDAKSAETWKAYKTASPDDPRRANPYYDGAADAYETAATRVLRRADALDPK